MEFILYFFNLWEGITGDGLREVTTYRPMWKRDAAREVTQQYRANLHLCTDHFLHQFQVLPHILPFLPQTPRHILFYHLKQSASQSSHQLSSQSIQQSLLMLPGNSSSVKMKMDYLCFQSPRSPERLQRPTDKLISSHTHTHTHTHTPKNHEHMSTPTSLTACTPHTCTPL